MTREDIIHGFFDKTTTLGLEIGPSHSPITPKRDGFNVEVVDRLDQAGLKKHYSTHGVNVDNIEEVDHVWTGETLPELTGKQNHYDWIISSHSVEHMPDMVTFLRGCESVLKDDGVLILAVPDKRYCFDHFRPLTSLSQLIDAYEEKREYHSAGAVADYCLNVVKRGGEIGWTPHSQGDYESVHDSGLAVERMKKVLDEKQYYDIHAWCFVPNSFRLLMHDLNLLGYLSLKEVQHIDIGGAEFFMVLSRSGEGLKQSRLDLMRAIENELKAAEGVQVVETIQPTFLQRVVNKLKRKFITV